MSTRQYYDSDFVKTQRKDLESAIEYRVNIMPFKNAGRCEKDGDLGFADRISIDSEMKQLRNDASEQRRPVASCSEAGTCSADQIRTNIESSAGVKNVKFVTPAVCFEYSHYMQNVNPVPDIKQFDPKTSKLVLDI